MNQVDDVALEPALLRTFLVLAAERHVTRAAVRLGMTQSAVSHALGRLRAAFGDPLFARGSKGVVPTERALELVPEVDRILASIGALTARKGPFDPSTLSRRFVVGGADFAEMAVLPALMGRLDREAPRVSIVSRPFPANLDEDLGSGSVDVALGVFRQPSSRLVVRKLFDERFVCLFRRGHPALKRPLTAERWAALRHVFISPRGEGGGAVDDVLRERGLVRHVFVRTASFLAAPLIVSESDCVLTLPKRVADAMMPGRPLLQVAPPVRMPSFTVALAFHERSRSDPAHAWLRDRIVEVSA